MGSRQNEWRDSREKHSLTGLSVPVEREGIRDYIHFSSSSSSASLLINFPEPQFLNLSFEGKSYSHHRVISIRDIMYIVSSTETVTI